MSEFNASREDAKARRDIEEVAATVVDAALQLHRDLGPGLLESVYEAVLAEVLEQRGLLVERQKPVPIRYQGIELTPTSRLHAHQQNEVQP
jgi:GxxExxY protein